jgi:hypothetical protein
MSGNDLKYLKSKRAKSGASGSQHRKAKKALFNSARF